MDDIILVVESVDYIVAIEDIMMNKSVLKFTYEIGYDKLAFSDVNIKINNELFQTSVQVKPTNSGGRLNYT